MKKEISFQQLAVFTIIAEVVSKILLEVLPILGSALFWLAITAFFLGIARYVRERKQKRGVSGMWFIGWIVLALFIAGLG